MTNVQFGKLEKNPLREAWAREDSHFTPWLAAKLARREGVKIVLDPLWRSVEPGLFEHIDGLYSGFPNPSGQAGQDAGMQPGDMMAGENTP